MGRYINQLQNSHTIRLSEELMVLLNQGMNCHHNDFLLPPKSPNSGGLSINYCVTSAIPSIACLIFQTFGNLDFKPGF
jgi:hypothetical protein